MTKHTEQTILLFIAIIGLVCLLAYTFVHTGSLLARYSTPPFVGFVAAFGIESIIAGMAWRYARSNKAQRGNVWLRFVLISALVVSALANVAEGFVIRYEIPLSWVNIRGIDWIQAIIGLSATGLISLLVFAISDIVGDDVHRIARQVKSEQVEQPESEPVQPVPEPQPEQVNYRQTIFDLLDQGANFGPTAMGEQVNCSKATASKWINEWQTIRGNGARLQREAAE